MANLTDAEITRLMATCGEFLERGFAGDFTPLMLKALSELQVLRSEVAYIESKGDRTSVEYLLELVEGKETLVWVELFVDATKIVEAAETIVTLKSANVRRKANIMLLREALQAMLDEDDGGMAADDAREALEISA